MRKLSAVTNNESRVVLMFNAVSKNLWLKVIEPFGLYGFLSCGYLLGAWGGS